MIYYKIITRSKKATDVKIFVTERGSLIPKGFIYKFSSENNYTLSLPASHADAMLKQAPFAVCLEGAIPASLDVTLGVWDNGYRNISEEKALGDKIEKAYLRHLSIITRALSMNPQPERGVEILGLTDAYKVVNMEGQQRVAKYLAEKEVMGEASYIDLPVIAVIENNKGVKKINVIFNPADQGEEITTFTEPVDTEPVDTEPVDTEPVDTEPNTTN